MTRLAAAEPFHRSLRRSRNDAPSTGTTPSPSRASRPAGTWSMISAGPGARRTRVPLGATIVSGTWQVAGKRCVLDHVADLAMDRQGDLGPDPLIDPYQLVARRMARDMDVGVVVGDHFDAARRQAHSAGGRPSARCRE